MSETTVTTSDFDVDLVWAVLIARHGEDEYPNDLYQTPDEKRAALRRAIAEGWWPINEYRAIAEVAAVASVARREALERDNARLRGVIERDRTGYDRMVSSLRLHVRRWSGIASSRGPYEWDDEKYFEEFGRCLKELSVIADRGEKSTHATDWTDCPKTQAEVEAARTTLATGGDHAK